ncbi:uncharacterized protein LOC129456909 [Periophthalmus magnuspinnatus]|uniref:uncharacterized protein LOC129456909 n=1 Tax=Periophthalmus magnuspinnatus TaxID=409849 RepID=UPI002436D4DE|nr:uncharacterized protein LOC129456909 [Periophthalmus magnuspinnatus]
MSKGQTLRALVNERLTAAAEEIFALFERTIAEYEEELCRSKEENQRNQDTPQTPRIKEEPEEQSVKQEEDTLPAQLLVSVPESSAVCVKTEESSLLHHRQTEHREETQGEDISTEPHLHSETEGHTEHSSDTDNDENCKAPFSCSAAQMVAVVSISLCLQVQKGQTLRALVNERLTAAAEEIFALFERTIVEYKEELCRSKEENQRNQDTPQTPRIKEEPEELSIKQEEDTLPAQGEDATCSLENVPSASEFPTRATQGEDDTCNLQNVLSTSDLPPCDTQHDGAGNSLNTVPSATSDIPTCDNQANENTYKSIPSHSESSDDDDAHVPKLQRTKSLFMKSTLPPYEDWCESTPDSRDEYVPDSCDESSSSPSVSSTPTPRKNRKSLPSQAQSPDSTTSCLVPAPANFNLEGNDEDEEVAEGQDLMPTSTPSVVVQVVTKTSDGSRMYNKRQYCLFCFKPFTKMARHLERIHSNEKDVAYAIHFPKGSKERKVHLESLRNKGNYLHNAEVIKTGKGELVPRKRPCKNAGHTDFMHCAYCHGLFMRKVLWQHIKICRLRPTNHSVKPGMTRVQAICAYIEPNPSHITKKLWKLLSDMTQDDITRAVKNDPSVLQLGQHFLNKCGSNIKRHAYIRQKMRELGRLLVNAQQIAPVKEMKDLIDAKNYLTLVKAVKKTCGYKSDEEQFRIGSIAHKLGHSLTKLGKLMESNARMAGDEEALERATNFQKVHAAQWNDFIPSTALRNISEVKWNVPQILPFTEDIQALHSFLDRKGSEYMECLSTKPSAENWSYLAKVCLAEVILFNRRREGEVSSMPLSAFLSRDTSVPHEDADWALSETEKKLCRNFVRIETKGKWGRKVPILLTPKMVETLELLVKTRQTCGVLQENPYLFARPASMFHQRGSCIGVFAKACGAKNPGAISSTKLRKHAATLSTVLNMNENEMDQLANFLGHDLYVHRQYYRLPEGTLQLAKISKVLMSLEQGRLVDFKGKNLDEIEIDPNEVVQDIEDEMEEDMESQLIDCNELNTNKERPIRSQSTDNNNLCGKETLDTDKRGNEKSQQTGPGSRAQKKKWEKNEVEAVQKHLGGFIKSLRVPGKQDCEKCIQAEQDVLKTRDWRAVKYFVNNKIAALKRKL